LDSRQDFDPPRPSPWREAGRSTVCCSRPDACRSIPSLG